MTLIVILIVFYLLPVWYSISFIRKSYAKGGLHEGETFENWLIVATFLPIGNLMFSVACFLSTPYSKEKARYEKIGAFVKKTLYGINDDSN